MHATGNRFIGRNGSMWPGSHNRSSLRLENVLSTVQPSSVNAGEDHSTRYYGAIVINPFGVIHN